MFMQTNIDFSAIDREWDVIVVGSGFAGMAAAIEAAKAGASTLVLEKMPAPGGNSVIDEGMLSIVASPQQRRKKISDSAGLFASDMMANGEFLNDKEKVDFITSRSHELYDWTVEELGVKWLEHVTWAGGHSVPRTLTVQSRCGREIYEKAYAKAQEYGARIACRAYVERINRDELGVSTLSVRLGYEFPDSASGTPCTIKARGGIVLAYGGFAADAAHRSKYDAILQNLGTTNQPGATGELWRESERIGCMMIESSRIQCTPWSNPKEPGMGRAWMFSDYVGADAGLWITTEGERFVNELSNRKVAAEAVLDLHRRGLGAIALGNALSKTRLDKLRPGFLDEMVSLGLIEKFDSIRSVESRFKIPNGRLQATIDRYNGFLKKKLDLDFMRPVQCPIPLEEGPWFAAEMSPKVHHCMGGINTNSQAQCLDSSTGEAIKGLFAAGECAGGVHGACRMGSCAILDCLVMGRVAGVQAAGAAGKMTNGG